MRPIHRLGWRNRNECPLPCIVSFLGRNASFLYCLPDGSRYIHSNVLVLRCRCTRRFDDDVIGTAFITFVALAYDIFRIIVLRPTTLYTIGITNIIAAFVFSSAVCCNDFFFIVCIFRNDITMTFAFAIATSGDAVGII